MMKKHAKLSGKVKKPRKVTTPRHIRKRREEREKQEKKIEDGSTKWRQFLESEGISPDEKGWDCTGLYNVYGTPTAWSKKMVQEVPTDDEEVGSDADTDDD